MGSGGRYALEESFMERWEARADRSKHAPPPNTVGQVPFAALSEREKQVELERSTLTGGAGARPTEVSVLGDAGLILARYAPVLSRMDVKMGVTGAQKLPYLSTQGTAAANAEAERSRCQPGPWTHRSICRLAFPAHSR